MHYKGTAEEVTFAGRKFLKVNCKMIFLSAYNIEGNI